MNLIWLNVPNITRKQLEREMNQDRMNNMQETYDNQEAPFDEEHQTQEEIELEADQKLKYSLLISDAINMEWNAIESFIDAIAAINNGEAEEAGHLLIDMLAKAADYNGSEANVPDFVRLVRMAFEWKSKQ